MVTIKKIFNIIIQSVSSLSLKWWGQLLLIALPLFIVFLPFLSGFTILGEVDETNGIYPVLVFYQDALRHQQNFLINNYTANGATSYASSLTGLLSPIFLLFFRFLPIGLAYNWLLFIFLILTGFFVTRLLKELGCSSAGSIFSGLTFSMACNFIDVPIFASLMWLALVTWLFTLISKRNSWPLSLLTGIIYGLGWLSGHGSFMVTNTLFLLIYAIFLILKTKKYVLIFKFSTTFFLALIVGLIQIIPNLVYVSASTRVGSTFQGLASGGDNLNLSSLIQLFLPFFSRIRYGGFFIDYLGFLPLFFAIIAIFLLKNKKDILFWKIIALFIILFGLPNSPLFKILQSLPIIENLRNPTRWMYLGFFSLAILSGFGFDAWLTYPNEIIKKRI
jgi:hypothetical protein